MQKVKEEQVVSFINSICVLPILDSRDNMNVHEEDNHAQYAMQLASLSVLPIALRAATELCVFEIIESAGPDALLSPSQIASKFPTKGNPDAPLILDQILRLLASYSLLTCSLAPDNQKAHQIVRLYGLAPVAKYFIRNQDGKGSLSPLLEMMQDKVVTNTWYQLKDAVLEGGLPFERVYGMRAIEYMGKDARFSEVFRGSMVDYNVMFTEALLKKYKGFDGLGSLVDVGGGNGFILSKIVSMYPSIKGINFDLPHIIEKSSSYPGNIEHVAGDMFDRVPKGDAIFMKWILHSWNDEHCIKLLKNCYEALAVNGKVISVELVIPENPQTDVAVKSLYQFDLFMMNMNPGRERTEQELEKLAKQAGFSHIRVVCCLYNFSVIEFHKNM